MVDGALNALATITALASGILDVFVNIGSAVVDNWSVIEPIAWGLVARTCGLPTLWRSSLRPSMALWRSLRQ